MAISQLAFRSRLYEEYLEEASFLYEQRRSLYNNPEITWKKIGEFEERLEAHIDGLVVGDGLALDICAHRAAEGDMGELFAATAVFCRQNRRDSVLAILDRLDPGDTKKTRAVADALKYELPESWVPDFLTLLSSANPKLAPVLAQACGYRRIQCGPELLHAAKRCAASALPGIVWALGRIAYKPAGNLLLDFLASEDQPVRSAAAVALARIGEPLAVNSCMDQVASHAWPILPLGLAGGRRALKSLGELAETNRGGDCLVALGLLGDPAFVPVLISRLVETATGASAATALECVTGAGLYETVFVPDQIHEDELFEAELEQMRQGKLPDRGDGRPFGSTVTRLSQNPEDWTRWWYSNGSRFTSGVRYRNGGLYSPIRVLEMLTADGTPHQLRQYCYEELVTRYQADFGIETDMPVSRQMPRLADAVSWGQVDAMRFREGEWYFAGQRCG